MVVVWYWERREEWVTLPREEHRHRQVVKCYEWQIVEKDTDPNNWQTNEEFEERVCTLQQLLPSNPLISFSFLWLCPSEHVQMDQIFVFLLQRNTTSTTTTTTTVSFKVLTIQNVKTHKQMKKIEERRTSFSLRLSSHSRIKDSFKFVSSSFVLESIGESFTHSVIYILTLRDVSSLISISEEAFRESGSKVSERTCQNNQKRFIKSKSCGWSHKQNITFHQTKQSWNGDSEKEKKREREAEGICSKRGLLRGFKIYKNVKFEGRVNEAPMSWMTWTKLYRETRDKFHLNSWVNLGNCYC